MLRNEIFKRIQHKREEQDIKWKQRPHSFPFWVTILAEELGELAKAVLEDKLKPSDLCDIEDEAIDVAAVAVAILEQIQKGGSR